MLEEGYSQVVSPLGLSPEFSLPHCVLEARHRVGVRLSSERARSLVCLFCTPPYGKKEKALWLEKRVLPVP